MLAPPLPTLVFPPVNTSQGQGKLCIRESVHIHNAVYLLTHAHAHTHIHGHTHKFTLLLMLLLSLRLMFMLMLMYTSATMMHDTHACTMLCVACEEAGRDVILLFKAVQEQPTSS